MASRPMDILNQAIQQTNQAAAQAIFKATNTFDVDAAYAGITNAETGSEKDPYIRTKVSNAPGGSTAFGPAQITASLAAGGYKNGFYSPEVAKFYVDVLKPRFDLMMKYGNEKNKPGYDPAYDYGGNANFDPAQYGGMYEMFAKETMEGVAKEANGNMNRFVEKWRGRNMLQDPGYFNKFGQGKDKFLKEKNVR